MTFSMMLEIRKTYRFIFFEEEILESKLKTRSHLITSVSFSKEVPSGVAFVSQQEQQSPMNNAFLLASRL